MSNAADYDMKKEAQTLRRTICNQSPSHWTLSLQGLLMPTLYHAKQNVYIRRSLKQLIRHKGCTARSSDLRKEHSHDGTRELQPHRRVLDVAVVRIQGLSKG
jgi:Uma2 family endonuclease